MKGLWKRFAAGISAVALTIGWHGQAAEAVPERYVVACVGDSITEGIGATSPALYSYPAQLQKLLGERYEVHNCGSGGTTLLKSGDFSYRKQSRYRESRTCNPHIVIIMLGTNDSKPQNWAKKEQYVPDLVELIQVYQKLESKPRVYVATSATVPQALDGITDEVVTGEVVPLQKEAARQTGCEVIDVNQLTKGHADWYCDGVHPNNDGYAQLAAAFADVLSQRYDPGIVRQWSARLDALPSNPDAGYASEVEALRFTLGQFSERQAALVTDQQKKRLAAMEEAVKRTTAAPRVTTTQPTAASQPTTTSGAAVTTAPTSPTQAATASEAPLTTASAVTGLPTTTGSNATTAAAQHTSSAVIWWVLAGVVAAAGAGTGALVWVRRRNSPGRRME